MHTRKEFLIIAKNLENELKELYALKKNNCPEYFKETILKYIKEIKDFQLKILDDIKQSK
jgi:predicted DNA-binding protein